MGTTIIFQIFILAVVLLMGATAARYGVLTGETKNMVSRAIERFI